MNWTASLTEIKNKATPEVKIDPKKSNIVLFYFFFLIL